jgi:hypothetical protein
MYQILSDLKDCIQTCFDQSDCNYQFLVSLGFPPADCSTIAVWLDSSARSRGDNPDCCTDIYDTQINITITRCCMSADGQIDYNPTVEEQDAQCFLDDLCKLRNCLGCNGCELQDHTISCGLVVNRVELDRTKQGGCYSATISTTIVENCCA